MESININIPKEQSNTNDEIKMSFFLLREAGSDKIRKFTMKNELCDGSIKALNVKSRFCYDYKRIESEFERCENTYIWQSKIKKRILRKSKGKEIKIKINIEFENTDSSSSFDSGEFTEFSSETFKLSDSDINDIAEISIFNDFSGEKLRVNFISITKNNDKKPIEAKNTFYPSSVIVHNARRVIPQLFSLIEKAYKPKENSYASDLLKGEIEITEKHLEELIAEINKGFVNEEIEGTFEILKKIFQNLITISKAVFEKNSELNDTITKYVFPKLNGFKERLEKGFGIFVQKFFDENQNNSFPELKRISSNAYFFILKISLFCLFKNIRNYFYNDDNTLGEGNEVDVDDESDIYFSEETDDKADNDKIKQQTKTSWNYLKAILTSLDENDDYFNYLSFINNKIRWDISNQSCFKFSKKNTHTQLKKYLDEVKFDYYVFYNLKSVNYKLEDFFKYVPLNEVGMNDNNNKDKITRRAFINEVLLNGCCCLNKKLLESYTDDGILQQNLMLDFTHEITHKISHKNLIYSKVKIVKSPNYKDLQESKNGEMGELLENLLLGEEVSCFLASENHKTCNLSSTITNPENWKTNLKPIVKNFFEVNQNIRDTLTPQKMNISNGAKSNSSDSSSSIFFEIGYLTGPNLLEPPYISNSTIPLNNQRNEENKSFSFESENPTENKSNLYSDTNTKDHIVKSFIANELKGARVNKGLNEIEKVFCKYFKQAYNLELSEMFDNEALKAFIMLINASRLNPKKKYPNSEMEKFLRRIANKVNNLVKCNSSIKKFSQQTEFEQKLELLITKFKTFN